MIKVLGTGGLGDVIIEFVKLQNKFSIEEIQNNIELTHAEIYDILFPSMEAFYRSQEIKYYKTIKVYSWDWLKGQDKNYDIVFSNHYWDAREETAWLRNKLNPYIKFDKIENVTIVLQIVGGRNWNRRIPINEVIDFCQNNQDKIIHLIGYLEPNLTNKLELSNVISHLNQGTIKNIIDLICSCNAYIGIEGFSLVLAGMMNKKIYARTIHNWHAVDPVWNLEEINNLESIQII